MPHKIWLKLTCASAVVFLGVIVGPPFVGLPWLSATARADDVSAETIHKSLKLRKTRALEKNERLDALRQVAKTRGLNHQEREELNEITHANPQIDLTIYFALDSAEISEQAVPQLNELGKALVDLKGQSFALEGHTDARGDAEYNLALSKRRAEAVKRYLVERFKIDPDALLAVGYGFEHPKNSENPLADENRRAQIVNVTR